MSEKWSKHCDDACDEDNHSAACDERYEERWRDPPTPTKAEPKVCTCNGQHEKCSIIDALTASAEAAEKSAERWKGEFMSADLDGKSVAADRDSAIRWAKRWRWGYRTRRAQVHWKCLEIQKSEAELTALKREAEAMAAALEKIADPRKRDHREPDSYTALGCVMNIADLALARYRQFKGEKS